MFSTKAFIGKLNQVDIIPEPTAQSAVPGVSPGRGLLIPHGYIYTQIKANTAKRKVHQESRARDYVSWVDLPLISKI